MAAETGSGKTGAFCLPILQIVYETLSEELNPKIEKKNDAEEDICRMNSYDKSASMGNYFYFLLKKLNFQ